MLLLKSFITAWSDTAIVNKIDKSLFSSNVIFDCWSFTPSNPATTEFTMLVIVSFVTNNFPSSFSSIMPFPTLFSSSVEDSKNIPFIANKIRTTFNPNKILQVVWSANAFVTNTYNPVASTHPNMQALEITAINSIKTENIHSIILSKNFILFSSIYLFKGTIKNVPYISLIIL